MQDQGCFSERSLALVAYEVLKVMAAAHSKGILHGDIKPANFVLASRNRNPLLCLDPACLAAPWLKAIDFGCSQFLDAGGGRFSKRSGTPMYMAPEVRAVLCTATTLFGVHIHMCHPVCVQRICNILSVAPFRADSHGFVVAGTCCLGPPAHGTPSFLPHPPRPIARRRRCLSATTATRRTCGAWA